MKSAKCWDLEQNVTAYEWEIPLKTTVFGHSLCVAIKSWVNCKEPSKMWTFCENKQNYDPLR